MRRLLPLAALLVTAAAAWFVLQQPERAGRTADRVAGRPETGGRAAPLPTLDIQPEHARATRYRMTYAASWGAEATTRVEMSARWDQQRMPGGEVQIALSDVQATEHDALPEAAALNTQFALVVDDGALTGVALPPDADALTRRTLAVLATAFWATPSDSAERTVQEEDLTGRYTARYVREGRALIKTVEQYDAVRGAKGLTPDGAANLEPGGSSRFVFDAAGLVRADVATTMTSTIAGADAFTMRLTARLVREEADLDPLAAARLRANRFGDLVDFQGVDAQMDAQLLKDADLASLLAELRHPERIDRSTKAGRDARSLLQRRLSALIRLEPEAAGEIAAAIKAATEAGESTSLLIGAMSSANSPAATDALADLVGQLPRGADRAVINGLNLTNSVTDQSLEALSDALDGENANAAALALGSQAKSIAEESPETAKSVVEQLIEGLAAARTDTEKATYMRALGNTGDRQALPALQAVMTSDPILTGVAIYAMRFMAGEDVDALIEPQIQSGGMFFEDAMRTIGYRDASRWVPVLTQMREVLVSMETPPQNMLDAIEKQLARWGAA